MVPLCWLANNIIVDFHNPQVAPANKREIGAAIYIAGPPRRCCCWGELCCACSFTQVVRGGYPIKYAPTKTISASGEFDKKHYV
ncbi:Claudin-5 [Nibea albiflora]|uniref:Claudin-5 n=1 Tax=Nibea albiflora TaxID=240163 RepID=A0ACB7F8D8_NIBAL|nr:Claudin-5 [Nibea albiflora]